MRINVAVKLTVQTVIEVPDHVWYQQSEASPLVDDDFDRASERYMDAVNQTQPPILREEWTESDWHDQWEDPVPEGPSMADGTFIRVLR